MKPSDPVRRASRLLSAPAPAPAPAASHRSQSECLGVPWIPMGSRISRPLGSHPLDPTHWIPPLAAPSGAFLHKDKWRPEASGETASSRAAFALPPRHRAALFVMAAPLQPRRP